MKKIQVKKELRRLNQRISLRKKRKSKFQQHIESEIEFSKLDIDKDISKLEFGTLISSILSNNFDLISSKGALYYFDGQYYREIEPIVFRQCFRNIWLSIKKASEPKNSKNGLTEIIINNYDEEIAEYINNYPHLVPFKNGYFNYKTKSFEECSQDIYLTTCLPYEYTKETNCPLFIQTMKEILPNEKDRIRFLTFIRTCFTSRLVGKALINIGDGNNAKSSVTDFFIEILGDLACDFNIDDATKDKGAVTRLKGKYLVVSNEIEGGYMNKSAQKNLKKWILNKFLSGRAAYGTDDHWRNTVTFIFNSNTLPQVQGAGKAFFRRFLIIFFNEDFTGREDKTRFDRILKEEGGQVISYILNEFSDESVLEEGWQVVRDIWNTLSNPLIDFINSQCIKCKSGQECSTSDIHESYVEWCDANEIYDVIAHKKFNSHMLRLRHPVRDIEKRFYFYPKLRLITTQDKIEEIKNTPLPDEMPKELEEMEEIKESRNPMEVNEDYFKKHYV